MAYIFVSRSGHMDILNRQTKIFSIEQVTNFQISFDSLILLGVGCMERIILVDCIRYTAFKPWERK